MFTKYMFLLTLCSFTFLCCMEHDDSEEKELDIPYETFLNDLDNTKECCLIEKIIEDKVSFLANDNQEIQIIEEGTVEKSEDFCINQYGSFFPWNYDYGQERDIKSRVCKWCKQEYTSKTIHRILYCTHPYNQKWFTKIKKGDKGKVMTCRKCGNELKAGSKHFQTCSEITKVTYLKYSFLLDTVFTASDRGAYYKKTTIQKEETLNYLNNDGNCPVGECDFKYKKIQKMRKHCKDMHTEKTMLEAYLSKKWNNEEKKSILLRFN